MHLYIQIYTIFVHRDPGALSALATSSEDKENMPRTSHRAAAPLSQTNPILHLLAKTNNDTIPSSSSKTSNVIPSSSNDIIPLSPISTLSHRTDLLQDCPVSPIFPPSPQPLLHDAEKDSERITNSPPLLSPSFIAAAHITDHIVGHYLAQADHNDHQLTQVEHQLTQEDRNDRNSTQEGNNTSSSERPAPIFEQEAPVIEHSTAAMEKHNEGGCVLGKRKSSERDSHSSDDGYCTCGSSCDSTPSSSSSTTAIGQTAAPTSCIYHSKVKRKEDLQSVEHQLVSEGVCSSDTYTSTSEGRQKESGRIGSGAELRKPMAAKSSNADVNQILADFDRICESPEAIAALQLEERQPKPTTLTPAIDYRPAEQLRSACATPQLSQLVEVKPVVSLVTDSTVSSSTGEGKMSDIELEIEMAKKEDEELKKAMEESLKQQVNITERFSIFISFI